MKNINEMKGGILLFEVYRGKRKNWAGSSRIRGKWLTKYWENLNVFKMGEDYDFIIYQKAYWIEHAKAFKGIKILDVCDPDFFHWGYPVIQMIEEVDAITTSTLALAELIQKFTSKPVICIPDRMDLNHHLGKKFHQGRAKWAVWFGYSTGFEMIKPVLHFLKKFELNLIVIADNSFSLPSAYCDFIELRNLPWSADTVNHDILSGDIVINPQGIKGKWKFKSNNKTLTAWALGMPVANNVEKLEILLEEDARRKESKKRLIEIQEKWDVKISIVEFKQLIEQIQSNK